MVLYSLHEIYTPVLLWLNVWIFMIFDRPSHNSDAAITLAAYCVSQNP